MTAIVPDMPGLPRIEIDGARPSPDQLRSAALRGSYGHFTAMQVRNRRVRGLDLHLARLDAANREVFGVGLDRAAVLAHIRRALAEDVVDASVRVYLHEGEEAPSVMVTVRPPGSMAPSSWRLRSVPYQRSLAHIKRTDDFGQRFYQRLVHRDGFDEALLTGPDAVISEGSITNFAVFDGAAVIWPAGPALAGITMQLIEPALAGHGLVSKRAHLRLPDLTSCAAAFVTNARGIAAVGQVDDLTMPVDDELMRTLAAAYESVCWDSI
jgi:branched-subunit amino acid aminotransferase/4-amino-4-deoxychorismate lyase